MNMSNSHKLTKYLLRLPFADPAKKETQQTEQRIETFFENMLKSPKSAFYAVFTNVEPIGNSTQAFQGFLMGLAVANVSRDKEACEDILKTAKEAFDVVKKLKEENNV